MGSARLPIIDLGGAVRAHAIYTLVVGALLIAWFGASDTESLAKPVAVMLLLAIAALVLVTAATYQLRTLLLVISTAVLSGLVLGLGLAAMLTEQSIALSAASGPFALGGLGAVWASYRRPEPPPRESHRGRDRISSPTM